MRNVSLWRALLGVEKPVIERVEFDEDAELLVAHVRPTGRARSRCGACGRRNPGYDAGEGRRRWRSLDLGTVRAVLEADAPRVTCPPQGVVVAGRGAGPARQSALKASAGLWRFDDVGPGRIGTPRVPYRKYRGA